LSYIGKTPTPSPLTSSDIADGIIITDKLANNAVVTSKITDATIAEADIANDAITLAKMASGTDGNIISYDTSGNPVAVATGSSGQVLTSAGAGAVPSFQASAVGGKIGQATFSDQTIQFNTNSGSYVDTGIKVAITPSASNSKVAVWFAGQFNKRTGSGNAMATLYRGSQQVVGGRGLIQFDGHGSNSTLIPAGFSYLDSPNTTSEVEYKLFLKVESAGDVAHSAYDPNSHSSFLAMEVLA